MDFIWLYLHFVCFKTPVISFSKTNEIDHEINCALAISIVLTAMIDVLMIHIGRRI